MFERWFGKLMSTPASAHVGGLALAFAAFAFAKDKLDASYALSGHPVDYATGQTTFDANAIKGFYRTMIEKGSLETYWYTQFIDFAFIASVLLLACTISTFVARFAKIGGWARRIALLAGVLGICGALFDVAENLVSFVMLSDPTGFPEWLALPYSTFATIKFALLTLAMGAVLIAALLLLFEKLGQSRQTP